MPTYPIQTGPSAPTTTFLIASQLGLALNCDLFSGLDKTTGAAAADDGPAINAAMAVATADNPLCLVMDGSSCVSGLKLPAGGHWSIQGFGRDTGFFAAPGTNNHVIHNGTSNAGKANGPAPGRGTNGNVTIRDIFINGNKGGNSTSGNPLGINGVGWYFNVYLESLNGIRIENVQFYNSPAFNLTFENCGDWVVDGCHFEPCLPTQSVSQGNTDGVHVYGPSNDGRVSNCYFRTGDDPIALNSPEGYGGLITRIAVTNCVSNGSQTMMRIYTTSMPPTGGGAQALVDGVTVTNYQGSATQDGLIIGNGNTIPEVNDSITNVTFTNCKFTSPSFAIIADSVGAMTFNSCDWIDGGAVPMFLGYINAVPVSSLNIVNCRAVRTAAGNGITALLGTQTYDLSTEWPTIWKRVTVNGFSVVDIGGFSGSPLPGLLSLTGGSTLAQLHIDAVDASNIAALIASGSSNPAAVAGGGVLQTGWTIADSAIAKWTPYVSATSVLPSYRNAAGTVVAL